MGRERNLPEHFPSELTLGCRVSAGKGLRQGSSSSLSRPLAPPGPHGPLSPRVQACLLRLLRGPLAERKSYLVQLGYGSVDLCPGPWDSWIPKPPSHEQAGRAGDLGPWLLLACCRGGKAHSGTGDLPARPSGLTTPPPAPRPQSSARQHLASQPGGFWVLGMHLSLRQPTFFLKIRPQFKESGRGQRGHEIAPPEQRPRAREPGGHAQSSQEGVSPRLLT